MTPPQAPSLPSPPFLPVEGVPNFRDAGGYPVTSPAGASIRRGVLFRSSEPSGVTEAGTAALQALRISKAYDLRSAVEIRRDGFRVVSWPGSERVEVPLLLDEDYAPEAVALRLRDLANGGTEVGCPRTCLGAGGDVGNEAGHVAKASTARRPCRTGFSHIVLRGRRPMLSS